MKYFKSFNFLSSILIWLVLSAFVVSLTFFTIDLVKVIASYIDDLDWFKMSSTLFNSEYILKNRQEFLVYLPYFRFAALGQSHGVALSGKEFFASLSHFNFFTLFENIFTIISLAFVLWYVYLSLKGNIFSKKYNIIIIVILAIPLLRNIYININELILYYNLVEKLQLVGKITFRIPFLEVLILLVGIYLTRRYNLGLESKRFGLVVFIYSLVPVLYYAILMIIANNSAVMTWYKTYESHSFLGYSYIYYLQLHGAEIFGYSYMNGIVTDSIVNTGLVVQYLSSFIKFAGMSLGISFLYFGKKPFYFYIFIGVVLLFLILDIFVDYWILKGLLPTFYSKTNTSYNPSIQSMKGFKHPFNPINWLGIITLGMFVFIKLSSNDLEEGKKRRVVANS
jgi:hypothetical protein